MLGVAVLCRETTRHKQCLGAINCTEDDDMYEIHTLATDLANEYTLLCKEVISPGCILI